MKAYIVNASSISVLPTFENGLLLCVGAKKSDNAVEPDYANLIAPSMLRRMTKVIRMGAGAALKAAGNHSLSGIIVGTGMGCYDSSLSFTKQYTEQREGALSPGAFILSSDNMIASQIAILLKSNAYNITYVNRGVSFENALVDAMLLCEEKSGYILVGGVDEHIPYFQPSSTSDHENNEFFVGEGSTFILLSATDTNSGVYIENCVSRKFSESDLEKNVSGYLSANKLPKPDLILFGNSFLRRAPVPDRLMETPVYDYTKVCGTYLTNSAFGLHLGAEILREKEKAQKAGFDVMKNGRILIVNVFENGLHGFTYLSGDHE